MVFEVLDNAIDEALAGFCDDIKVIIHADVRLGRRQQARNSTDIKEDDEEKRSAAEIVMTRMHAGGKFDQNSYKVSESSGVGVSVVNALSSWLKLRIWRNGKISQMEFRDRVAVRRGRCRPDRPPRHPVHLAPTETFSRVGITTRSGEASAMSFLNNGTKIELIDQRDGKAGFAYLAASRGLSVHRTAARRCCTRSSTRSAKKDGTTVEVAMQWNDSYAENVQCFTNSIPQRDGGTRPACGNDDAHAQQLHREGRNREALEVETTGDDTPEGLRCVLSVKGSGPSSARRRRTSSSPRR